MYWIQRIQAWEVISYIDRRYFKHPIYKYKLYFIINDSGKTNSFIATREIKFKTIIRKEINNKRELQVHLTNPDDYLRNKNFASTFAPVPKYKKITERNIPSVEFPALRLADPINFYPTSFSSWRKKIKLNI